MSPSKDAMAGTFSTTRATCLNACSPLLSAIDDLAFVGTRLEG